MFQTVICKENGLLLCLLQVMDLETLLFALTGQIGVQDSPVRGSPFEARDGAIRSVLSPYVVIVVKEEQSRKAERLLFTNYTIHLCLMDCNTHQDNHELVFKAMLVHSLLSAA